MPDHQMLQDALKTIRAVASTESRLQKICYLQSGDSPYLRSILDLTYNRFRTYRITQIDMPERYNNVTVDIMGHCENLLGTLKNREIKTRDAKTAIKNMLAFCTEEDALIFANIIKRDLRAGIDVKIINEAFPGLIPTFDIQLAKPLDTWERVPFPVCVEEKVDEIRCIGIYDGGCNGASFYSRNGFEFTGMDAFSDQLSRLMPGSPNVFDGGFKAVKFNPDSLVCQNYRNGNWQFEYAKALANRKNIDPEEVRKFFKLYIWDVIDLEYFQSQGKSGKNQSLETRKVKLASMFGHTGAVFSNIEILPNYIMHSQHEVLQYMKELKAQRKEGCMLKPLNSPYTFGKNYTWMKLKHFIEGDFRIVDAFEGEGKYTGMLGGLVVVTDDGRIRSKVGTGISDAERLEWWVEYLAGRLTGRIVELQIKDVTGTSLQLPVFIRFRDDKDNTDSYEELQEKLGGVRGEECE